MFLWYPPFAVDAQPKFRNVLRFGKGDNASYESPLIRARTLVCGSRSKTPEPGEGEPEVPQGTVDDEPDEQEEAEELGETLYAEIPDENQEMLREIPPEEIIEKARAAGIPLPDKPVRDSTEDVELLPKPEALADQGPDESDKDYDTRKEAYKNAKENWMENW